MLTIDGIKQIIEQALPGAEVFIKDPRHDGVHLEAIVIAEQFTDISLIKQHQLVMGALKEHFVRDTLHALALKTYTPAGWKLKELA